MDAFRKFEVLKGIIGSLGRVCVAFSSGVDSGFLLWVALNTLGPDNVLAAYCDSPIRKRSSVVDAVRFCASLGLGLVVVPTGELSIEGFVSNGPDRCYICKKELYGRIKELAVGRGFFNILDGTLADDLLKERPGMRALKELGILTPLVDASFTKKEVRKVSKHLGISLWSKPSDSCLATRISPGFRIGLDILRRVEISENLISGFGVRDFRLRHVGESEALLEVRDGLEISDDIKDSIRLSLEALGYTSVEILFKDPPVDMIHMSEKG